MHYRRNPREKDTSIGFTNHFTILEKKKNGKEMFIFIILWNWFHGLFYVECIYICYFLIIIVSFTFLGLYWCNWWLICIFTLYWYSTSWINIVLFPITILEYVQMSYMFVHHYSGVYSSLCWLCMSNLTGLIVKNYNLEFSNSKSQYFSHGKFVRWKTRCRNTLIRFIHGISW